MATQQNQQQKSSLEVIGLKGNDKAELKEKPKGPELTAATAAERHEAGSMEAKTESMRGRAGVSLENLEQRANERNYSAKSAQEINGIKLNESPEKQRDRMDSLYDVSAIMLANLFYQYPNTTKELDVGNFDNVGQLAPHLAKINPRSAESAALYKLTELSRDQNSEVTKAVKAEWPRLIRTAQEMRPHIKMAMDYNPNEKLKDSEKWTVKGFIHDYPKTAAICGIAGAIGGFFAIRGIWRLLSGASKKADAEQVGTPPVAAAPAEEKGLLSSLTEAPKGLWGKLKWILGGGLILAALGSILKFAGIGDWIKKIGGSLKDGLSSLLGEDAEFKKDKEFYKRMAGRINNEMKVPVDPKFLAEKIGQEKFNDFAEDDGWLKENLLNPVLETDPVDGVAKLLPFVYTRAQRKQAVAVRTYLKGSERQAIISKMTITDETTVVQVLAKIDEELNIKEGIAPTGSKREEDKETAPAVAANETESKLLPYLKSHYGEISPNELRDISLLSYSNFTSTPNKWLGEAKELASEAGLTGTQTPQEIALNKAKDIMRRFLDDKKSEIAALGLPAGASIGIVLAKLVGSWEKPAANPDTSAGAVAIAAGTASVAANRLQISNDDIEGAETRDQSAEGLPPDTRKVYLTQKSEFKALLDENKYVKNEDATKLIATGEGMVQKITSAAGKQPEAADRKKVMALAVELERKVTQLKLELGKRTQCLLDYNNAIKGNGTAEELHRTFLKVTEANHLVAQAYDLLETSMSEQSELGTSIKTLAALQLPRAMLLYALTPTQWKNYVRHYYGVFGLPTAMISRLSSSLLRPSSGLKLAELRVAEGESRVHGELGGSLEKRANPDTPDARKTEGSRQAMERYLPEKELWEHDKKILQAEREVDGLKRQIAATKDPAEVDRLKSSLEEKTHTLELAHKQRIPLERKAVEEASEDLYKRLEKIPKKALDAKKWREFEDLAKRGAANNRDTVRASNNILKEIEKASKAGKPISGLQAEFNDLMKGIPKEQKKMLGRLSSFIDEWRAIRGVEHAIEGDDQKHFRKVLGTILNWQKKGASDSLKSSFVLNSLKGNKWVFLGATLVGAAGIGVGGILGKDEKTSFGKAAGQAALDLAPITGTISDFYTMITGQEKISGKKVTGYDRWLMRPLFGVVGAISDVALVAGGSGLLVRGGLGAVKGGVEAARIGRMLSKGDKVMEAAEVVAKAGTKAASKEGAEVAGTAAARGAAGLAESAAETTAEQGGKLAAFLKRLGSMQKVGTVAAISLGAGIPLAMSLNKVDEMEITPGMKEAAGIPAGGELNPEQLEAEAPSEGDDFAAAA